MRCVVYFTQGAVFLFQHEEPPYLLSLAIYISDAKLTKKKGQKFSHIFLWKDAAYQSHAAYDMPSVLEEVENKLIDLDFASNEVNDMASSAICRIENSRSKSIGDVEKNFGPTAIFLLLMLATLITFLFIISVTSA